MRLPRATAVALLTLLACAIPLAARPRVDRPPPSSRLVLENGLEVILIPNRTSPLITSVAVVRAGSAMERPEVSGISHMLEHLLFSGTARRTHDQIAAAAGVGRTLVVHVLAGRAKSQNVVDTMKRLLAETSEAINA